MQLGARWLTCSRIAQLLTVIMEIVAKGLSAGPCTCEAVDQVCYVVANRDLPVRNVATLLSYVAELVLKWCEQSDSDDSRARCALVRERGVHGSVVIAEHL